MKPGLLLSFFLLAVAAPVAAQNVPPAIQQELNRRNMTEAEARAMAQQLGVNLNDPVQAAQRARELGVPEPTIQEMLRAVRSGDEGAVASTALPGVRTVDPSTPATTVDAIATDETTRQATEAAQLRDVAEAETTTVVEEAAVEEDLAFFGYSLFDGIPDAFQPSAVGPVDDAYLIGPGDELRLTVWGAAEFAHELTVDAEGRIFVPNVGQFLAAGRRIDRLRTDLQRFLSRSYSGLTSSPPTVFMDLSVARLRPVQVYVLGEVSRPGGYTVSPNATAFNVLYSTGGPLTRGSLREIRIVRAGRRIGTLDLYNYLLSGYERNPVRLQTNDFVFVPSRGKTVAISGAVRRPAVFELKGTEDFTALLEFAGGLLPDAYGKRFQIERIVPLSERTDPSIAREIIDLPLAETVGGEVAVTLEDGDVVRISAITDRLDNAVTIQGEVFQPGRYQLSNELVTIRDLIGAADGLTEIAHRQEASLVRLDGEFNEELYVVDLEEAIADNPLHNLPLRERDVLTVRSRLAVQQTGTIEVDGQVRNPGPQPFRDRMTLQDALYAAGGLQDSLFVRDVFLPRADLFRREGNRARPVVVPFNLAAVLDGRDEASLRLIPGDRIRVYPRSVERLSAGTVQVSGAVNAPGTITFVDGLTVEDAILQSGGFSQYAYLQSVRVARPDPSGAQLARVFEVGLDGVSRDENGQVDPARLAALLNRRSFILQPGDQVSVVLDPNYRALQTVSISGEVHFPGTYAVETDHETIGSIVDKAGGVLTTGYLGGSSLVRNGLPVIVDIEKALLSSRQDMQVLPGDVISVPRKPNTVQVAGNVNNPGLIRFAPGRRVKYYLDRAGSEARETEAVFLTQADGATYRLRRGLFPQNPVVTDGAVISVSRKQDVPSEERTDVGQIITETISVLSAALTAIVLASRL
ncbi:MAG: SLBB domain-containing protein [Rhodothermales bacterium]|nr:SLBB domain-containing protein [Rhodothermales bacterium]MBO6781009.1 SLBB domain-containing protein [Rhodothermales bacterium]